MTIRKFFGKIRMFPRKVKWFIQRGKRGYADCDLWNFDTYLAKLFKNGLNDFANNATGWPDGDYETFEEWIDKIREIAALTDYFNSDNIINWDSSLTNESWKEAEEQAYVARSVFFDWMKEHFCALWD